MYSCLKNPRILETEELEGFMIEGEKKFDPQEVERVKKQLPEAEKELSIVRGRIEKSSKGYYTLKVSLPEGRTEWKIDMDVVRMMGGGILRMYDILLAGESNQTEKDQSSLVKPSPQEKDR